MVITVFERVERDGLAILTVPGLFRESGIGIAFSERVGGVSVGPYRSLNLRAHVGDDSRTVDVNRMRLLKMIGIGTLRDRLVTAEQVHGIDVCEVTSGDAGSGAFAEGGLPPVPATDALMTRAPGVPLMLLYADCVPVVLARPSVPAVAVVHAGRRGLVSGIVGRTAVAMAALPGSDDLVAFVGAHIGPCCYEVCADVLQTTDDTSLSPGAFATITATSLMLDLGAMVTADLERSGVPKERQWHLGICTAHNTDRFYSYRAEGLTGRHGALAVIL